MNVSNGFSKIALSLGILAIAGGLAAWLWFGSRASSHYPRLVVISDNLHQGDSRAALDVAREVIGSPTVAPEAKAAAAINTATVPYDLSGSVEDARTSIRELKHIAADESLSRATRASAMNMLALWYAYSGNDRTVFKEIFGDEPYASQRVPGSRTASIRNIFLASYDVWPTSRAWIGIASSYISQLFGDETLSTDVRAQYLAETERYLREAEALTADERAFYRAYEETNLYAAFLYWKAYALGGLAYFQHGGYGEAYRQAYDELIAFLSEQGTPVQKRRLALVEWRYATYLLLVDNDAASARAQLEAAVSAVSQSPDPEADSLTRLVRSILADAKGAPNAPLVEKLNQTMAASPEFKAWVESL